MRKLRMGLLLLLTVAAIAGIAYVYSFQVTSFTVKGNANFTAEQIITSIYPEGQPPHSMTVVLNRLLKKQRPVPFLDYYEVHLTDRTHAEIEVWEMEIIGCLDYAGSYLYFSKNGALLLQKQKKDDMIPVYEGIVPKYIARYQTIETDRPEIFERINQLAVLFRQYELQIERIHIGHDNHVTLFFNDVKVQLGSDAYIEEKLAELCGMYEQLKDLQGTLNLSTYDPDLEKQEFHFKQQAK